MTEPNTASSEVAGLVERAGAIAPRVREKYLTDNERLIRDLADALSSIARERDEAREEAYDAQISADTWLSEHKMSSARAETAEARVKELEGELDDLRAYREVVNSATACDAFDEAADKWLAMFPIDRMLKAITSVFAKWSNDDIMGRFREKIAATMHLAFVEGCLVGKQAAEARIASLEGEVKELREAIQRARGLLLYTPNEHLDDNGRLNTTGLLAVADTLLAVEPGLIKPEAALSPQEGKGDA